MIIQVYRRLQKQKFADKMHLLALVMWVVLSLAVTSSYAELVCHYKFDGNLIDSSANNYPAGDGTLQGDTHYVEGKFGQALDFDGAGDFVRIMTEPGSGDTWIPRTKVSNSISITMWVRMDSYPRADADLLASRSWNPGDNNLEFHQQAFDYKTPFFVVQQGRFLTEFPHKRISSDKLGKWIHLAVTYDVISGESYMYIDGVPGEVAPITSGAWVTIGNYTVGGNESLDSRYFDGQIDDLRIYDHALSSEEVQQVYTEKVDLCGSEGYLESDLNRDCYVDSEDMSFVVDDWLKSTKPDDSSDELPVPGTVLCPADEEIPDYDPQFRKVHSLAGEWELMTENPIKRYQVNVPGVWQNQGPGMSFHGVGYYKKQFDMPFVPQDKRLWLHFENVATQAKVILNGHTLGSHLGAWTPFEFDITDFVESENELIVKVDEKPGHFTAGFIPVIGGSFGGIWGDVWVESRPESFINDMFVTPDVSTSTAKLNIEIHNSTSLDPDTKIEAKVFSEPEGNLAGTETITVSDLDSEGDGLIPVTITNQQLWSPQNPNLYTMQVSISDSQGSAIDRDKLKFGMRDFKVQGSKLVLNGNPIYIASILHWGLYPQYLVPACTEEEFRQEMREFKECGFNAVNVCLFMFPDRYYEIANEEGIILWQEYPFWNNFANAPRPQTQQEKDAFVEEYKEMFRKDRRFTNVLLRSITLEDHNMNVELIGSLYHLAHEMIPDSVVQDNSSEFYQVNSITDFVDHHPYVEVNHWKSEMASWMHKVNTTYDGKPFLFGEAFDFDTFRDIPAIQEYYGDEMPWWTILEYATGSIGIPGYFGSGNFWNHEVIIERLESEIGSDGLERIKNNSYKHSLAARKYEIEQSRLYDGFAGLCITGLRDNQVTRPGIYDDLGNLKFPIEELRKLNAQTIPLIDVNRQSRCYRSGETADISCYISHYEPVDIADGTLSMTLASTGFSKTFSNLNISNGSVVTVGQWNLTAPDVTSPTRFELEATLTYDGNVKTNSWHIWVFPEKGTSVSENITLYDPEGTLDELNIAGITADEPVMIASSLDSTVTNYLNSGGKVILIDLPAAAFPSHNTPFWREVAVERYSQELFGTFPLDEYGTVDLQFFDMTSFKGYNTDPNNTPMFRTINCRRLGQNDLIIKRGYDSGLLIATTLNLTGQNNVAGQCLLRNIVDYLCR